MEGNSTTEYPVSESDNYYPEYDQDPNDQEFFDGIIGELMDDESNQIKKDQQNNQINSNYANDEYQTDIQFKGTVKTNKIQQLQSNAMLSCLSKMNHDSKIFNFFKMYKVYAIALLFYSKQTQLEEELKFLQKSFLNFKELHTKLFEFKEFAKDPYMETICQQINEQVSKLENRNLAQQSEELDKVAKQRKCYAKNLLKNLNFLSSQILCQLHNKSTKLLKINNKFQDILVKMQFKDLKYLFFDNEECIKVKLDKLKTEIEKLSQITVQFALQHIKQ
ncbi:hypothetical protein ABPG74_011886 [Tetrahymena malaccensis]